MLSYGDGLMEGCCTKTILEENQEDMDQAAPNQYQFTRLVSIIPGNAIQTGYHSILLGWRVG